MLERGYRGLPAVAGAIDQLLVGLRHTEVLVLLERLLDRLHVIGDAVDLLEQVLGLRECSIDVVEQRCWQAGEMPGLIEQHLGLVPQPRELVIDLL